MRIFYLILFVVFINGCSSPRIDNWYSKTLDVLESEPNLTINIQVYNKLQSREHDTVKAKCYLQLARNFYNLKNYDYFGKSARAATTTVRDLKTVNSITAYRYLGTYFLAQSKPDSALLYAIKSERIIKELSDYSQYAKVCILKAGAQIELDDPIGAEYSAIQAFKFLQNSKDLETISTAYTILGVSASVLEDHEHALRYHQKALRVVDKAGIIHYPELYCTILNNIGNSYEKRGDFELAVKYYRNALMTSTLSNTSPQVHSILLDNLGYSLFQLNELDEALKYLKSAYRIRDSLNLITIIDSNLHLSEYYQSENNYPLGMQYSKNALHYARKFNSTVGRIEALNSLATYRDRYSAVYLQESLQIADSIKKAERKMQKKINRIRDQTDELISQKEGAIRQKWIFITISILTILTVLIVFLVHLQQSKKKEFQYIHNKNQANEDVYNLILEHQASIDEVREKEKKRIAKELHDGIMNKLTSIRLNLFILNKKKDTATIQHCLKYVAEIQQVEKEIRSIALDLNLDNIDGQINYESLLAALFAEQKNIASANCHFQVDESIRWDTVTSFFKVNIYRILQETLQNINKHSVASNIIVSIISIPQFIKLEISDDGIGFRTNIKKSGLGLRNIKARILDMGGTLSIKSNINQGTTVILLIPNKSSRV